LEEEARRASEGSLKMPGQSAFFESVGGDEWYRRNHELESPPGRLEKPDEMFLELVRSRSAPLTQIVEVGCSRGDRLFRLCSTLGVTGIGIEPSNEAVAAGEKLYGSRIDFRNGVASSLPLPEGSVDVLLYGFCLYLLTEAEFDLAVAETKRVLTAEGWFGVFDFDSEAPSKTKFSHNPGVFSFRRNYLKSFLEMGFTLISKTPFSHETRSLGLAPEIYDRTALWVFSR
jgi:ubiquinone/menaquinone biosynthesis C-methylase UbiE